MSSSCYYPNGDPSKEDDIPCGNGDGVACCPSGWTCQNNGLCYLANEQYYGRYTCTDKSWKSDGCPQICTHGKTASGNEAILECSTNSYCCDANRPDLGCCDTTSSRFSLDSRKMEISEGGSSPTASSSTPSKTSSTVAPEATTADLTGIFASSAAETTTSQVLSSFTSQGSTGVQTVVVTSKITAAGASVTGQPQASKSGGSTNTGAIVGGAVGGAVALIALAALLFLLIRRRRRRPRSQVSGPSGQGASPMYKNEMFPNSPYPSNTSELQGSSPELPSRFENADQVGAMASKRSSRSSRLKYMSGISRFSSGSQKVPPTPTVPEVYEMPGDQPGQSPKPARLSELSEKPR